VLGEKEMIWKGIKAIRTEAIKQLEESTEQNYLFYSAPKGYKMIMSGIAIAPPTWKREIVKFGFPVSGGRQDRIFIIGEDEGSGGFISTDEKPVLELVKL
jgi:hypothetical protein